MSEKSPYWRVPRILEGETVFVIGGGLSLDGFDWTPIHDFKIIGCNDAYLLGDWVDICYSGDNDWLRVHSKRAKYKNFKGLKISCSPNPLPRSAAGTKWLRRWQKGIVRKPERIAWNTNTGASAITLAVKMGATKIVLLGFDMKLGKKNGEYRNNWHPNEFDVPNPDTFPMHYKGFESVKKALTDYPKIQVLNAGPDSELDLFTRTTVKEVIKKEEARC